MRCVANPDGPRQHTQTLLRKHVLHRLRWTPGDSMLGVYRAGRGR